MAKINTFTLKLHCNVSSTSGIRSFAESLDALETPVSNLLHRFTACGNMMIQFDSPCSLEELQATIVMMKNTDEKERLVMLRTLTEGKFEDYPPSEFIHNCLSDYEVFVIDQVQILHSGRSAQAAEFDAAYSYRFQHYFGKSKLEQNIHNHAMREFLAQQERKRKRSEAPEVLLPVDAAEAPGDATNGTAEPAAKKAKLTEEDEPEESEPSAPNAASE